MLDQVRLTREYYLNLAAHSIADMYINMFIVLGQDRLTRE
jgi:hypothetical protein